MKLEFAQELSPQQTSRFQSWKSKLPEKYTGAIGGRFTYSFTPTTLGVVTKVKDVVTGQELDLTDYLEW